jgi:hypothetical protein
VGGVLQCTSRTKRDRTLRGIVEVIHDRECRGIEGDAGADRVFQDLLAQMRVAASAELFPSMASGYRAEIEKMQREVLD